jgi:hypothetical protein
MKTLNILPDTLLAQSDKVLGFVNTTVSPAFSYSADIFSSIKNLSFLRKRPHSTDDGDCEEDYDRTMDYCVDEYTSEAYWKVLMRYVFAESVQGGTDDAFLCLKRGPKVNWGYFEDFDEAVPRIFSAEARRKRSDKSDAKPGQSVVGAEAEVLENPGASQEGRLCVHIYFAENDSFIGKKGRRWMDDLWRHPGTDKGSVIYESTVVEGSDHDSIDSVRFGVLDQVFENVRELWVS